MSRFSADVRRSVFLCKSDAIQPGVFHCRNVQQIRVEGSNGMENYSEPQTLQISMGTVAHLQYDGPDERLQGTFVRRQGLRFARIERQSRGHAEPNGRWAHEVWVNETAKIAIYDHEMRTDLHLWSIGPWSSERGGVADEQRYAYLSFGKDEGEDLVDKPSEWWLQRANICNGWVGLAHGYSANGGCAGKLVLVPQGREESYHRPLWRFYISIQYPVSVGEQDTLWYTGKDSKFLTEKRTFTRDYNLEYVGAWANEVWLEASHITQWSATSGVEKMLLANNVIAIYDHQFRDNMHFWSIGPWSPEAGGALHMNRFAYAFVTQDAVQKMKAAIGLTREVESKDVLTIASICNGWEQPHETYYRGNGGCNGGFDAFIYSTASADRVRQAQPFQVLTTEKEKQNIQDAMMKEAQAVSQAQAAAQAAAQAQAQAEAAVSQAQAAAQAAAEAQTQAEAAAQTNQGGSGCNIM